MGLWMIEVQHLYVIALCLLSWTIKALMYKIIDIRGKIALPLHQAILHDFSINILTHSHWNAIMQECQSSKK